MGKEQSFPQDFDMRRAMTMAGTPAGQRLLAILRNQSGPELQRAMEQAVSGDHASAKQALAALIDTPEVRSLLKQLEGENHVGNGR